MTVAIIIEFSGGFMDGKRASTDSEVPAERDAAYGYYAMTEDGTPGQAFRTVSDAAIQSMTEEGVMATKDRGFRMNHKYEVAEKIEEQGDVVVRVEYVGQED